MACVGTLPLPLLVGERESLCSAASHAYIYSSGELFCKGMQSFRCYFCDVALITNTEGENSLEFDTAGNKGRYKKRHWGCYRGPCHRPGFLPRWRQFSSRTVKVGFMVDKLALGQVVFRTVQYSPVNYLSLSSGPLKDRQSAS
jgi:hypothetical protein